MKDVLKKLILNLKYIPVITNAIRITCEDNTVTSDTRTGN